MCYHFSYDLGDADYVGYTTRHLFQRVAENKYSAIGKHILTEAHRGSDLLNESSFKVLKKCQSKFDCLVFEMLYMNKCKRNSNLPSVIHDQVSMNLAEHSGFTNWGDYISSWSTTNQIKCWFLVRGENRSTRGKTSQNREENQQTLSTSWRWVRKSNPGHIGGRRVLSPLHQLYSQQVWN